MMSTNMSVTNKLKNDIAHGSGVATTEVSFQERKVAETCDRTIRNLSPSCNTESNSRTPERTYQNLSGHTVYPIQNPSEETSTSQVEEAKKTEHQTSESPKTPSSANSDFIIDEPVIGCNCTIS